MTETCCKNTTSPSCLGKTYPDNSKIENPKKSKTKINKELITKLENCAKSFKILNIGYVENIEKFLITKNKTEYKSAIILTIELTQKILDIGAGSKAQEYNDKLYENFGEITYKISDFLRENGYQTEVAHPYEDKINFSYIGESAGLGSIGKSGLLISPEFGPKQKISGILTKIENFKVNENEHKWIKEYCKKCGSCIKKCPENALSNNKTGLNSNKCIGCSQGCAECIKACPFYKLGYFKVKKIYEKIGK